MDKDKRYQQQIFECHDFIEDNLYFNRPDLAVKERRFNSALLFGLLTVLNMGKQLIMGEPGLGKTTSAEYICSLLYQVPIGTVWGSEVSGHPEQTEEKIIGRPDLGELNRGNEEVVWSYFAQLPVKIVDEINRLPETKQSVILDGVDRGNWEYLNEMIINEEYSLFATANYQDMGTNSIIAPMVDRFDVIVESRHPGPNIAFLIGQKDAKENLLRHPVYEQAIKEVLGSKIPHEEKMERFDAICNHFGRFLFEKSGIKPLTRADRLSIKSEIQNMSFDLDSNAFIRMILSELSYCYAYGQKRSVEVCEEGCHYTGYMCYNVQNCASNRLPSSIKNYCQALAWLLGDEAVDLEHVRTIVPYTIAHRIQWKEEYLAQREMSIRNDPLQIHLGKEATKAIYHRYVEQSDHLKHALSVGNRCFNGEELEAVEGDHPIYAEIKKDMESAL
ncbi:MAG: AAA family ATPase [Desulfatiglans sp.]|jgi:MoxR-like ATPase|nr:AAA family ATPase [Thermodesulfobacteriota bacterium]MEE4351734.1 AAA family ATPase [Desulfatiglans sp.]